MPRRPDPLQGLEKRYADGQLVGLRAEVRIPGSKKKARGPWRSGPGMVAEARGDRAQLLAKQGSGQLAETKASSHDTVAVAVRRFLDGADAGRPWARGGKVYAPKTLRGYRQDAELWVIPALGDVPVDRLRRSQLQGLVDEVELLRSGQRARNVATVLQALYRYLLPRHDDLQDPTVGLELPQGSAPRNVIVAPDELEAMVEALAVGDRAPFGLAGMAGLRAGELKALLVEDVVLDAPSWRPGLRVEDCARIVVRASWDAVEGRKAPKHREAGEGRLVPVLAPLRPLLEGQLASLGDEVAPTYPFLPGKGAKGSRIGLGLPLDTDQLLVRCRAVWSPEDGEPLAPEGFRLHDARHSFASHLIAAGVDVATVALWIGHEQASTTLDRYVKPLRQRGIRPEDVRAYLGL